MLITTTGPWWYHLLSYSTKLWICAALMVASLTTVGFGESVPVKLLGVAFASAQQGLGEPTFLALSSYYSSRKPVRSHIAALSNSDPQIYITEDFLEKKCAREITNVENTCREI